MSDTEGLVRRLFIEAAAACGEDPLAISRHVASQLEAMSDEDRKRFQGVAEEIAAYKHDAKPPTEMN